MRIDEYKSRDERIIGLLSTAQAAGAWTAVVLYLLKGMNWAVGAAGAVSLAAGLARGWGFVRQYPRI